MLDIDKYKVSTSLKEILLANAKDLISNPIFELVGEGIVLTDLDGLIIGCNNAALELHGYNSIDEVRGMNAIDLISSEDREKFNFNELSDINSGSTPKEKFNCLKNNGEVFTAKIISSLLEDKSGNPFGYLSITSVVTDESRSEQDLLQNKLKYESIFENSTMGIYRGDSEGNILVSNSRFLDILGIDSIDELQNKNIDLELNIDPSIRKKFHNILLDEGKVYGFESQWRKSDGALVYLRESATAFLNNDGKLDYYEGTVEDITENVLDKLKIKKQAEIFEAQRYCSELFLSDVSWQNNLYNAITVIGESIDASSVHVFKNEINTDNAIIFKQISVWKNSAQKIDAFPSEINLYQNGLLRWESELSQNKLIVENVKNLNHGEKSFLAAFGVKSIIMFPIMLDGNCWGEITFHQNDYDRIWDNSEFEALRAASETLSAAIKRSNYEKELIEAKKAAEAADKTKSEFLAQISHEIRTPLNNITSFNTLIKEELENQINDDVKECFDVIDRASKRLIRTIGLILNLSELHTDSYKLQKSNFDIYSDLIERIYLENRFVAKQRKIYFKLINNAASTLIYADKYSLDQIFNNLVDNAFKYTEEGKIEIEIKNNENDQIIIKVSDSGIGISEEYLPNIFTPFSQEDAGYTRKYDGNGIGLTLVKEYCDLNEIQIDVSSKKNFGSTFTLTLKSKKYN